MRITSLIIILIFTGVARGQNPATYPSDTTLSMPEKNFETLWLTFQDNYAFFKLRHIDWQQAYNRYRPQINSQTSDDSLYTVFTHMLAPFQDNHINLIIPSVKQFKSIKPSQFRQEFFNDSLVAAFWGMVDHTLAKKGFSEMRYAGPGFNGRKLFSFTTSKTTGYLRFNRCFVSQDADNIPDTKMAGKILDSVFADFKNVKNIVIDVRDNVGGNDEFAFAVADRFADEKILGMTKRTRKGGYEDFGKAEKWYIQPAGNKKKFRTVTLLTNDKTVSAGDVYAMIMKELPRVKIIGTNTRGIYSDMYGFTLPNKWLVSLSNQRYYNAAGVCYEGNGTPVNQVVKNTKADLEKQTDPVLSTALSLRYSH